MTLGARIAALRRERGLSQEALGELVGVSRQAVSKWESDSALPDVNNCVALSRAFGITLAQLLELEEEAAPSRELTKEQLELAEAIAKKYLESLPRPKGWRQRRKWPWVLAAAAVLVLASVAAQWVRDLNRTVNYMTDEMLTIQNTVSDAVEQQVNAALEQVTSLVESFDYTAVEVNLWENTTTFDLSVQLRQRTADTPVILAARSGGETVSVQGEDQGSGIFSARITCPLSDAIDFSLTFQMDGENHTQTVGQAIQMCLEYSLQPVHQVLYTSAYTDKKLVEGHLPKGTVVPLEYTVTFDQMDLLTEPIYVNGRLGVFVNDQLDHWVEDIPSQSLEDKNDTYFSLTWKPEVDLSGLDLKVGDQITLALSLKDNYDRTLSQVLWRGSIGEDGGIQEQSWGEEEAYPPVEEAREQWENR